MTFTKKGCMRGMAQVTVALLVLIGLLIGVAFGGDKVLDIIVGGQLERQAAISEHERQERVREAEAQTEIEKEEALRWMEIRASAMWLILEGGLALVALGLASALMIGSWRLALGRVRSMREGAAIGHAWASKSNVPQSLTYSPNLHHSIKDVTTEQLAQLPAQLPALLASGDLASQITSTLAALGLAASAKQLAVGPQVTTFGITPKPNDKGKLTTVSQIRTRADDLAVALAVASVRISPAPGYVAVEVPRQDREMVELGDLLASKVWQNTKAHLPLALGKDTQGQWVIADLVKLPHLLAAGATGGGKSVAVNSMLAGLMNKYTPQELKLTLIDPKQVEFMPYNGSPYLAQPVIIDATKALPVLESAIKEMERRYTLLAKAGKKEIVSYNKVAQIKLPWFVIVIDELADLMMVAEKEVEAAIVRLGQKARAVGLHIILATQRPSADVVTGLIKANFPGRHCFAVVDGTNSEIVLDERGAEGLLGMGDGLFKPQGAKTMRVQAPFISDDELVQFLAQPVAPQPRLTQSPQLPAISLPFPPVAPEVAPISPLVTAENSGEQRVAAGASSDSGGDSAVVIKGSKGKAFAFWDMNPKVSMGNPNYDAVMDIAEIKSRSTARSYYAQWKKARV